MRIHNAQGSYRKWILRESIWRSYWSLTSASSLSFKRSSPLGVDDAALNFPQVNFILGHAGVTLYRQAALMAQYRPNIYLDLSGFQGELYQGQFKKILKHHLSRKVVRKLL